MASLTLAMASPATHPWMGDTLHLTRRIMALPQPTSQGLHHKVNPPLLNKFAWEWVSWEKETPGQLWCSSSCHRAITLECPSICYQYVIVHVYVRTALCLCILIQISTVFSLLHIAWTVSCLHLPVFAIFPLFLVFQVILLSQAFPLRLWLPTQSQTSPLLLTWVIASSLVLRLF